MGELAAVLRARVEEARRNLRRARVDDDEYGADVFAAELADLQRRAAAHGVAVPAYDDQDLARP